MLEHYMKEKKLNHMVKWKLRKKRKLICKKEIQMKYKNSNSNMVPKWQSQCILHFLIMESQCFNSRV